LSEAKNVAGRKQAETLNKFVSENFVIAHIEGDLSADGDAVIESIGYDSEKLTFVPYILAVNNSGQYAGHLLAYQAMRNSEFRTATGEEYREFDRIRLLAELKRLRTEAMPKR